MNPIDSNIAKRLMLWTGTTLFSALTVFMATQALRLAPFFAASSLSVIQTLQLIFFFQIPVTGWAITPAFIISVFAVAGAMSAKGEFTAIDSAGISRIRLLAVPSVFLLFLFTASTFIWIWAAPLSIKRFRSLAQHAALEKIISDLDDRIFNNPLPGLIFYADKKESFSQFTGIYIQTAANNKKIHLFAKSATLNINPRHKTLDILLRSGDLFIPGRTAPQHGQLPDNISASFKNMTVSISLDFKVDSQMQFIPLQLTKSTYELTKQPPASIKPQIWNFELWRRVARPFEFLLTGILTLFLSFFVTWQKRWKAYLAAAALFFWVHILSRGGEVLMQAGHLSGFEGAFLSVSVTAATVFLILVTLKTVKSAAGRL